MSAGKICSRVVVFANEAETLREAAIRMRDNNVGTLVILDDERRPAGIVTDRDIVTRGVADDRDAVYTTLAEVMTREAKSIHESTPIEEALRIMERSAVRRLVVVADDGTLAGLLSLDDVMELLAQEAGSIGRLLRVEAPVIIG